jgi:hypothetical protein
MSKPKIVKSIVLAVSAFAGLSSTAAIAEDYYTYNDGNGTCGILACGAYGCVLIYTYPCPLEVNGE